MTLVKKALEIRNVVASANLGQNLDLNAIAKALLGVQYRPEVFPGLVYRLKKPRATALIFRSGKMVCAGASSERQAKRAVIKVVDDLKSNGIVVLRRPDVEIQNIVATADLGCSVDLEKAAYALERAIYDPEQFPGLILRVDNPKASILIFGNGRIVCAGAKKEKEAIQAVTRLKKNLENKKLIRIT